MNAQRLRIHCPNPPLHGRDRGLPRNIDSRSQYFLRRSIDSPINQSTRGKRRAAVPRNIHQKICIKNDWIDFFPNNCDVHAIRLVLGREGIRQEGQIGCWSRLPHLGLEHAPHGPTSPIRHFFVGEKPPVPVPAAIRYVEDLEQSIING